MGAFIPVGVSGLRGGSQPSDFSSRWVFLTTLHTDARLGTTWGARERGML